MCDNPTDKFGISEHFEFDERQGDYYGNASSYIGLTYKDGQVFKLTALGERLSLIKNRKKRNLQVIKAILKTRLFNDLLRLYFHQDKRIEDQQIIARIAEEGLTGTTPARRKGTVKSWLSWIIDNLEI